MKELIGDTWKTRSVNSFAPRLFSAISLPDAVLGSRTIRLPMIASADRDKTRRSPLRIEDWPCDLATLIDDLWLLGVENLSLMRAADQEAAEHSALIGRSHDIFRMPLAVAYWLEVGHGAEGLFDRISSISEDHQNTKLEFGGHDLVSLVLMAVNECLGERNEAEVFTKDIVSRLGEVAQREEYEELGDLSRSSQRVGHLLRSLGFKKAKSHGSARAWVISRTALDQIAVARGIQLRSLGHGKPVEVEVSCERIELPA